MLGAADTFRAAAIEQLDIWGQRVGVPVIKQKMGSDPAAVAFDTLQSAKAQGADVVIIDTAGRLPQQDQPNERAYQGQVRDEARGARRAPGDSARS